MLNGTACDWLKALASSSYDSWDEFSKDFIKNFEPLAVRSKTFEELRACIQKQDELLRSYIRRCTEIRNSVRTTSEDMVIDVFIQGLTRQDFKKTLRRQKPTSVASLLKIATKWTDGVDLARWGSNSSPHNNYESGSRSHRDSYRDNRKRRRSKRPYNDDRLKFVVARFSTPHVEHNRSEPQIRR